MESVTSADRPVVTFPPRTPVAWALEILAVAALLGGVVMIVRAWPSLPETIPHHFDHMGRPDAWGGRGLLVTLPIINLFIYLLLTGVHFIPPHLYNFPVRITAENAARQYAIARSLLIWLKAEVSLLFAVLTRGTIQVAIGEAEGLGGWMLPVFLTIVFGTVGIHIGLMFKRR